MKRTPVPALHACLLAAFGTVTMTAAVAGMAAPTFRAYDGNGDGTVSIEEFQAQGGLVKAFYEGDLNRDGRLSREELVKASASNDRLIGGQVVDDAWITTKVKTMLLKDDIVKNLSLNVETRKGTVQLSGWADDEAQIVHAEQVARHIDGVRTVRNELQINQH